MSKNNGPEFLLIPNCKNCNHLTYFHTNNESLPGCGFLSQPLTENKKLHVIFPDKNCPLVITKKEEFLKSELNRVKLNNLHKVENIIKEMFPDWKDFAVYSETCDINFRIKSITISKLLKLNETLINYFNYSIEIVPFNFNEIIVKLRNLSYANRT